jgi:hypothetical protein
LEAFVLKKFSLIAATTLLFVACDNSSSDPSSPQQEGASKNTVMDTLPFDTTGIKSQTISFLKPEEIFTAEGLRQHKEKYGEFWENYIVLEYDTKDYCKNTHSDNNGIITMEPGTDRYDQPSVFVVRDDSLMLGPATYCRPTLSWGACDSASYYSGKITVGNNDFYYNEVEKQLIQLNDSSITVWYADGRLYVPFAETDKDSINEIASWAKELFEDDSMLTIIENKNNSYYVDTIIVEKYNVKITDEGYTWIFENETCKAWGYKNDPSKTSSENCNARAERYNESFDCIRRNMGAPEGVRVSLCRPKTVTSLSTWCILDQDKPKK